MSATADLDRPAQAGSAAAHLRDTLRISAPIAAALLSEVGMGLITTLYLGGISDHALAAGAFATNVFITSLLLQGALSGVGVLSADRIGAERPQEIPALYWSGVVLAIMLAVPLFGALTFCGPVLRALGQPAPLVADIDAYMHVLRWAVPAGVVGIGMMRNVLPALGLQRLLLWVMPCGVVLHAALNRILIYGAWGLPALGVRGSALATVVSMSSLALIMLALLHGPRHGRHVAPARPLPAQVWRLTVLGLPSSGIVAVEAGLFLATGVLAGGLGPTVLAAHMIALSVASVSFMVPLAISQAANVRVATAMGAGNPPAARVAGFCAIALGMAFMGCSALVLSLAPHAIARLYLGPVSAANAATAALAVRLLHIAGLFQIADGTQVVACAALRGLQDVRVPAVLASLGYWAIGFPAGWFLARQAGLGAAGLWWGLFAGLASVAVALTLRFARRTAPAPG